MRADVGSEATEKVRDGGELMREASGAVGAVWALTRSGFAGLVRNAFFWIAVSYASIVIAIAFGQVVIPLAFFDELDDSFRQYLLDFIITPAWLLGVIGWFANVAVVIVVAIVGTRTLARDRVMGGLEFILSKSVPPWGYVLGRAAAPVGAALILLFIPMLSLALLLEAVVDDLPATARGYLWSAVLAALVTAVLLGTLGAGLGSLVSQPRRALVLWLLIAWAPLPLAPIARFLFDVDWWWLVGPLALTRAVNESILGQGFPGDHAWLGWIVVVLIVGGSLAVIRWRVREVVR